MKMAYRSAVFLDCENQNLLTQPLLDPKAPFSAVTGEPALELRFYIRWLGDPADSLSGLRCRLNESLASCIDRRFPGQVSADVFLCWHHLRAKERVHKESQRESGSQG